MKTSIYIWADTATFWAGCKHIEIFPVYQGPHRTGKVKYHVVTRAGGDTDVVMFDDFGEAFNATLEECGALTS